MGKWKNDYNATRKYNQRWEEGRDWLHGTPDEKCYCSICNCTFNPKKSVVKQHEISGKHRNAVLGIKPRRVYRKLKTEPTDEKEKEENITFSVLNDDDPFINSTTFQNVRESGDKNLHSGTHIQKSIASKIEYVNGTQVVYLNSTNEQNKHESEESLQKIVKNVTNMFKSDLERFLKKNPTVTKFIENNGEFCSGVAGMARLTRMLVGNMAQHYLIEYTVESCKNKTTPSCSSMFANKLDGIEKKLEQSVKEMKNIKEEFSLEVEAQNVLTQSGIVLDGINVDI
ncbi:UNVERIFIED_CONTAM: hypothetical protein RMT77_017406 [Armadillidium vulgare]